MCYSAVKMCRHVNNYNAKLIKKNHRLSVTSAQTRSVLIDLYSTNKGNIFVT